MDRAAWTDKRFDDLAESIRTGFARTDQDIRELRAEMRAEFAAVRSEMGEQNGSLSAEIDAMRQTMLRIGAGMLGGMMFGFLSVIAAILARGA